MAVLTVNDVSLTGLTWTAASLYVACAGGGDDFANDGKTYVHLKNTNAASRDVTFNSTANCDQGFDHNIVVTVAATTGEAMVGPFPMNRFLDANGRVNITYSAVTNLTIAVFSL